ncbi:MAG: hypothetical protein HKL92_00960 [Candidatus Eremiobacteraeota bacterium]|nr:hypothetical protein [Candidatus Eremiobacteraeota bacterium]NNM91889.1 hypothetical protein [Candidatus Eremiobacteraeota bacterium]
MRFHDRHRRFALAPMQEAQAAIDAASLAFARLEPGWSLTQRSALDLGFRKDDRWTIVFGCEVEVAPLLERESSVLLWPLDYRSLDRQRVDDIERAIFPWLRVQFFNRRARSTSLEIFDSRAGGEIERAREMGLLGVTRYTELYEDLAPYVYAARHVRSGTRAAIVDSRGAVGALSLERAGARISLDLGDLDALAFATRWLDIAPVDLDRADRYDIAIANRPGALPAARVRVLRDGGESGDIAIPVTIALPPAITVSFDPDDGPTASTLGISFDGVPAEARASVFNEPAAHGGSSGRIAMLVRGDALANPDADTMAMHVLARRLEREGFEVGVFPVGARADLSSYDLVHAWGSEVAPATLALLQSLPAMPLVASLSIDDPRGEAFSGPKAAKAVYGNVSDAAMFDLYFAALGARSLSIDSVAPEREFDPLPAVEAGVRAMLGRCDVAILSGPVEEALLRSRFGWSGSAISVSALVEGSPPCEDAAVLVGEGEFVLCDLPVEARCNQIALALAAKKRSIPIVFTGPVIDHQWFQGLMESMGVHALWIPQRHLNQANRSWLRARARVVADCAWSGRGIHSVVAAAATGAFPLLSAAGYGRELFAPFAEIVDPGAHANIEEGLVRAWERAPEERDALRSHVRVAFDQTSAFIASVTAYQLAGERARSRTPTS